jgi:hypothetical protein
MILSDTVKSYFNNYTYFCWEKSINGITWTTTGVCGTKVPVLVNGLWVYVVDTSFVTVKADSGTYYRLKVGTTFSNLNDATCSVNNSQKIFVKVYNVVCNVLEANSFSFYGSIINNKARLRWTSQNEENLKEYEVEKSVDGTTFTKEGVVAAANDINGASYAFSDPEKITSLSYYRLKLISQSKNDATYSKIVILYNKDARFKVSAVNPFKTNLKINIFLPGDGKVEFNLCDLFGKIISKKSLHLNIGNSQVNLDDVSRLPAGMYILSTSYNNTVLQNKLYKAD